MKLEEVELTEAHIADIQLAKVQYTGYRQPPPEPDGAPGKSRAPSGKPTMETRCKSSSRQTVGHMGKLSGRPSDKPRKGPGFVPGFQLSNGLKMASGKKPTRDLMASQSNYRMTSLLNGPNRPSTKPSKEPITEPNKEPMTEQRSKQFNKPKTKTSVEPKGQLIEKLVSDPEKNLVAGIIAGRPLENLPICQ